MPQWRVVYYIVACIIHWDDAIRIVTGKSTNSKQSMCYIITLRHFSKDRKETFFSGRAFQRGRSRLLHLKAYTFRHMNKNQSSTKNITLRSVPGNLLEKGRIADSKTPGVFESEKQPGSDWLCQQESAKRSAGASLPGALGQHPALGAPKGLCS